MLRWLSHFTWARCISLRRWGAATPALPPAQVLQQAVCPERRRGFDGALSALASVTEVQISNDLQVAKVYLSIYRCMHAQGAAHHMGVGGG